MSRGSFSVGSAFAEALSQMGALESAETEYRIVDLVNIGRHCADAAHGAMEADAARARELLITGASRMLAAAERLEHRAAVTRLPTIASRRSLRSVS